MSPDTLEAATSFIDPAIEAYTSPEVVEHFASEKSIFDAFTSPETEATSILPPRLFPASTSPDVVLTDIMVEATVRSTLISPDTDLRETSLLLDTCPTEMSPETVLRLKVIEIHPFHTRIVPTRC